MIPVQFFVTLDVHVWCIVLGVYRESRHFNCTLAVASEKDTVGNCTLAVASEKDTVGNYTLAVASEKDTVGNCLRARPRNLAPP